MSAISIGRASLTLGSVLRGANEDAFPNFLKSIMISLLLTMSLVNFGKIFNYEKEYYWLMYSAIIYCAIILSLQHKWLSGHRGIQFSSIALFFCLVVNAVRSHDGIATSLYFIVNILVIPYIAFFIGKKIGEASFLSNLRIVSIILFPMFIGQFFLSERDGDFSGGLATGSVFGGVMSLISVIFFISYVKRRGYLDLIIAIVSCALLFFSSHRAGILALACAFLVCLTYRFSRGFISFLASQLVIIFVLLASLYALYIFYPQVIFDQFFGNELELSNLRTAGRATIWPALVDSYLASWSSISIGGGLGHAIDVIAHFHGDTLDSIAVPHNEFLRILLDTGMVGFFLVVFFYKSTLLSFRHSIFKYSGYAITVHLLCEMLFSNVIYWAGSYVFLLMMYAGALHNSQRVYDRQLSGLRLD